mmetsp:Transcript_1642/g.4949  ORF Transcript_1642/g.4949 Transcript_1642/m.4949 type:complete len:258 (-) Transcript_1642:125-898(-)
MRKTKLTPRMSVRCPLRAFQRRSPRARKKQMPPRLEAFCPKTHRPPRFPRSVCPPATRGRGCRRRRTNLTIGSAFPKPTTTTTTPLAAQTKGMLLGAGTTKTRGTEASPPRRTTRTTTFTDLLPSASRRPRHQKSRPSRSRPSRSRLPHRPPRRPRRPGASMRSLCSAHRPPETSRGAAACNTARSRHLRRRGCRRGRMRTRRWPRSTRPRHRRRRTCWRSPRRWPRATRPRHWSRRRGRRGRRTTRRCPRSTRLRR